MFPLRLTWKACGSPIRRRSAEWAAAARLAWNCGVSSSVYCSDIDAAAHFCNVQRLGSRFRRLSCLCSTGKKYWKSQQNGSNPAKHRTLDPPSMPFHPMQIPFELMWKVLRYHNATICARFIFKFHCSIAPICIKSNAHRVQWHLNENRIKWLSFEVKWKKKRKEKEM